MSILDEGKSRNNILDLHIPNVTAMAKGPK
jgi:hypothetical protein